MELICPPVWKQEKPEVKWKIPYNLVASQLLKFSFVDIWGEVEVKSQVLGNQLASILYHIGTMAKIVKFWWIETVQNKNKNKNKTES